MRTIERLVVSALILSKDNKLLMGTKNPKRGGVYSDSWHIPGGGIEEDETQLDALKREIQEEVGIDIANENVQLVSDDGTGRAEKTIKETGEKVMVEMKFFVYKIMLNKNAKDITVLLSDDIVNYKWFDLSELSGVKIPPPSITLFKKLGYRVV